MQASGKEKFNKYMNKFLYDDNGADPGLGRWTAKYINMNIPDIWSGMAPLLSQIEAV